MNFPVFHTNAVGFANAGLRLWQRSFIHSQLAFLRSGCNDNLRSRDWVVSEVTRPCRPESDRGAEENLRRPIET